MANYTTINGPNVTVPGVMSAVGLEFADGTEGTNSIMVGQSGIATWGRYGKASIGNGATSVAVTAQDWPFIPTVVVCSLSRPTGGLVLGCAVVEESITADGFTVELSAATNSADYKLHFTALP